jgi:hypothetical protein
MLLGALALSAGMALWVTDSGSAVALSAPVLGRAAGPVTAGPFLVEVERFEIHPNADGRPHALVQMHLWRPGGPVPLDHRVRIDGQAWLGRHWVPVDATWLLRNEYVQVPDGPSLHVAPLGDVPATHHAGEARAVFEFVWTGGKGAACPVADFLFELPDGPQAVMPGLLAVQR